MFALKTIWLLALACLLVEFCQCETYSCPWYCQCSTVGGMRQVQCTGRGLIAIDSSIPNRVEWLKLSHNNIYALENKQFLNLGMKHVRVLELDHNAVRTIGLHTFYGLWRLESVDLSHNYLRYLQPALFEEHTHLKYLNISDNPLGYFDEHRAFLSSTSLQALDLSNCRLGHLPWVSFGLLPRLQMLNVSSNQLVTLQRDIFTTARSLVFVDISKNPMMICDSHISNLDAELRSSGITLEGSPCKGFIAKTEKDGAEGKKYDKMVAASSEGGYLEYQDVDYYYDGCDCKEALAAAATSACPQPEKPKQVACVLPKMNLPMALTLAGLAGFVIGLMMSAGIVLLSRARGTRRRMRMGSRSRSSRLLAPSAPVIEGEPPPTYTEVFYQYLPFENSRIRLNEEY